MKDWIPPEKPWPGSVDGSCPECGLLSDGWDMEYHVARTSSDPRHGLSWVAEPGHEKLIALTCPGCRTKFRVADLPP